MAVSSPWNARGTLRMLIDGEPVPIREALRDPYLPPGMTAVADQPRTIDENTPIGGYGDPSRYVFPAEIAAAVAAAPQTVLGDPAVPAEVKEAFLTTSLDLTMQGGTTSGVVYPLAVCELATGFRFRNVGGASAGAIAAALTAAAELGRIRQTSGAQAPPPETLDPPGTPRVRQGFAGLADLMAWLTQTGAGAGTPEEFRLAQLFRPGPATHNVFRLAIAAMRRRIWTIPPLALSAFGPLTRTIAVVLMLATVVVVGLVGARLAGEPGASWHALGWGLLDTAAYVVGLIGVINLAQGLAGMIRFRRETRLERAAAGTPLDALQDVTSGIPITRARFLPALVAGVALIAIAAVDWVVRPAQFLGALVVGLSGTLLLTVWLLIGALALVDRFGRHSYGLIGGTAAQRPLSPLDRLAGAPTPTVTPSLVPWLNGCLTQLAGLPDGEVLRFGHLWYGLDYRPGGPGIDPAADPVAATPPPTDRRLVNLELMATDLTRRRPYKFPLTPSQDSSDELWLRIDQLRAAAIFPDEVLAVLAAGETRTVQDRQGNAHTYHRLPAPAELPVIFAVRVSMALPALFQAVPMHRFVTDLPIRDDLGRRILLGNRPLTAFTVEQRWTDGVPPASPDVRADQLWFSDGGITSNFPVHFFDATLPRWPTVSLNLGSYPAANPVEDVWLPQDWEPNPTPTDPLRRSGLVLPGAILETAMSWRDSMQSAMPGYRNRIAQVRSRRDEGGTNLFMTTETIASLALRGVVAGARLRARYSDRPQWDRFRWLRLRVAMSDLEQLRDATCSRQASYAAALAGRDWLDRLAERFVGEASPVVPPTPIPWYDPGDPFWPGAADFLDDLAVAGPTDQPEALGRNPPLPEPKFRQVPQE